MTGLYQLSKTCYLHSLLCNNSIIAQFPEQNDIISICTWENDNTDNSHATSNTWLVTCTKIVSRGRHMTKQLWEYWHASMPRNGSDTSNETTR